MMRLPAFRYRTPQTVEEAAAILAGEGPSAMLLAGGTDLLPNMKRRQQVPETVVALRGIDALRRIDNGRGLRLGASVTLASLARHSAVREIYPGLWQAVVQIASPHLRSMGTIGGNLCLDTRCNYYDQSEEWRQAIGYCMKKDGETCWVATSSPRCLAVSSTDGAPALMALGARVRLVASHSDRTIALGDLYQNDGMHYLRRRPDEILTEILLDPPDGMKSVYWKLRRRGSFDFPVLSVAACARFDDGKRVEQARIVLGAVASQPLNCPEAAQGLVGQALTDGAITEAAERAARWAKPMDNTDFTLHWRKRVTAEFVSLALRELRGDDVREARIRWQRRDLASASIVG